MPKRKKPFIPKDKSVTFHLVHRSQQDPLIADETAPQRVLIPQVNKEKRRKNTDEEHKYGIYFDDDYDYLQHLKTVEDGEVHWEETSVRKNTVKKTANVQLPSSVFASQVEEDVGLLNKAAPISGLQLHLDPDVVAAMDEDFDYDDPENQLEDNFLELANAERSDVEDDGSDFDSDEEYANSDSDESEQCNEDDDLGEFPRKFGDVETKSRFTDYSLTSSVIRRNEQLSLLDDRFEKVFEAYDENEIGSLDCDEIEGTIGPSDRRMMALIEESNECSGVLDENSGLKDKILTILENTEEDPMEKIFLTEKEKWDCESILSLNSNIYNHPAKIVEPKGPRKIKVNKAGMPVDELEGRGGPRLTSKNLAALNDEEISTGPRSIVSMVSELSQRPKDETPEQRRIRKHNLKEYRRERRKERKANTEAFAEEKIRQEKVLLNLRNNLRGVKIL